MFGDQPEAADLGRKCENCRVELETDCPWCQLCTEGETSLWGKNGDESLGKNRDIEGELL